MPSTQTKFTTEVVFTEIKKHSSHLSWHLKSESLSGHILLFQADYEVAAKLYKRATEIKEEDTPGLRKVSSRQSSGEDTTSTVKNALNQSNQYYM
jgi:hypothetical protein